MKQVTLEEFKNILSLLSNKEKVKMLPDMFVDIWWYFKRIVQNNYKNNLDNQLIYILIHTNYLLDYKLIYENPRTTKQV